MIRTFLVSERSLPLIHAVCEYSGESGNANVTWLLHDNSTVKNAASFSAREGSKFKANVSYDFPLALHEGSALTCLIYQEYGPVERRVLEVPKYCEYRNTETQKSTAKQGPMGHTEYNI